MQDAVDGPRSRSAHPRVWRTPHALQFGVERPVLVLEDVGLAEERMLAALASGAGRSTLRRIARTAGAGDDAVDALLGRIGPVLLREQRSAPTSLVVLDGAGRTAARIVSLLGEAGLDVRAGLADDDAALDAAGVAVIVAAYAVAPARHRRWLRRDIPHLPVVFGDAGVTVGPFVTPGAGPCLRCGDLARRDADPAWPVLAAQLHLRPIPGETELVRDAVASAATTAVLARLAGDGPPPDVAMRFDPRSLRWSRHVVAAHPECGCLSLAAQGPFRPGTGTPAC